MRQLSVNEHGELILVGLTVEEPIWAVDYKRRVNKSGTAETREAVYGTSNLPNATNWLDCKLCWERNTSLGFRLILPVGE